MYLNLKLKVNRLLIYINIVILLSFGSLGRLRLLEFHVIDSVDFKSRNLSINSVQLTFFRLEVYPLYQLIEQIRICLIVSSNVMKNLVITNYVLKN